MSGLFGGGSSGSSGNMSAAQRANFGGTGTVLGPPAHQDSTSSWMAGGGGKPPADVVGFEKDAYGALRKRKSTVL